MRSKLIVLFLFLSGFVTSTAMGGTQGMLSALEIQAKTLEESIDFYKNVYNNKQSEIRFFTILTFTIVSVGTFYTFDTYREVKQFFVDRDFIRCLDEIYGDNHAGDEREYQEWVEHDTISSERKMCLDDVKENFGSAPRSLFFVLPSTKT